MVHERRKVVFSGVQPSGRVHIGNYVGALSVWVKDQDDYDGIFCVVDLHALTIPERVQPDLLREKVREVAGLYLAVGIDPGRSTVFVQSDISSHAELAWILTCATPVGWLERMTQYKSKSAIQESIGAGLLCYPVLQAADILLYRTDLVPVGEDQKQHIELARDIGVRFNNLFGDIFRLPEPVIRSSGARIMAFDDPTSKMSKSVGEIKAGHSVGLLDSEKQVRKTLMGAVTDSGRYVDVEKPSAGVANLLTLYQILRNCSDPELSLQFAGKGYGYLKKQVCEAVLDALSPIQDEYRRIRQDERYLDAVLHDGALRAGQRCAPVMAAVRDAVGIRGR